MFEHFGTDCRRVVSVAHEEARRMRHPFVGTEHVLIGALDDAGGYVWQALHARGIDPTEVVRRLRSRSGDSLDPDALSLLGIDLDHVRTVAEQRFGAGALERRGLPSSLRGHLPLSRRVRSILILTAHAVRRSKQRTIHVEHLIMAMIDEGGGVAVRTLRDLGLDLSEFRLDLAGHAQRDAA